MQICIPPLAVSEIKEEYLMNEFEPPVPFEPEKVPEERRERMYTFVQKTIDTWNAEDYQMDEA